MPAPGVVREVLLGRHGPYGDPRASLDALDDVEALVAGLEADDVVPLAAVLVDLATDADAIVATGAILALDIVRRRQPSAADRFADAVAAMIDLVLAGAAPLDRPPVGFTAASQPTLRAELALVAARSASLASIPGASTLVERAGSIGVARVEVVAALAERLPALVVAQARSWVGPEDSAVLARLRPHHHRLAVAMAARPWTAGAMASIEQAGRWQRWHDAELAALLRVMRDEAPELTVPVGAGDLEREGRWWIVAEALWDWTLWRCDDGRSALERVQGGVGLWTSVQLVPDDVAAAIVAATIAGTALSGRAIDAMLG